MNEPGVRVPVKSFDISKWVVWEAYQRVKANKGAAGVDGVAIEEFEEDRDKNLYRIWNRMASGSYFPPPVLAVEIPKPGGKGVRILGVPTIADRVAQTVARMYLEPAVEPMFHPDSYGYRPGRSALDAVGACRKRCWKFDWVIDLDIRKFFDSVPHDLILRAVAHHTDQRWILLYVTRWLQAPLAQPDGTLVARDRGTPQGSAISPLLANLFMHYAFDRWMASEFPSVPFERYCDDAVVHCGSQRQAYLVRDAIAARLADVGLELHPDKTCIVYCKTTLAVATIRIRRSHSWDIRFARDWPRAHEDDTLSASYPRSAGTPSPPWDGTSGPGVSAAAAISASTASRR
jgi:RNA-directed DNA polymerase